MKYKTQLLARRLIDVLSPWQGVECVSLNESALPDTLDPYFALILDVFRGGPIPESEERRTLFGPDIEHFETSSQGTKDRFLLDNLPVRIEYKSVEQINELVSYLDQKLDSLWFIKDSGTYGFYRLANGELLLNRSGWIDGIRNRLLSLDTGFWIQARDINQSKMEHFLGDLGAAMIQEDTFFYIISAAGFIKFACLTLFCVNRRFEPSHRGYHKQVLELPALPESFAAQFETFLRLGKDSMERSYKIAQLIARGVASL